MRTTAPTQPDRARAELRRIVAGLLDASGAYANSSPAFRVAAEPKSSPRSSSKRSPSKPPAECEVRPARCSRPTSSPNPKNLGPNMSNIEHATPKVQTTEPDPLNPSARRTSPQRSEAHRRTAPRHPWRPRSRPRKAPARRRVHQLAPSARASRHRRASRARHGVRWRLHAHARAHAGRCSRGRRDRCPSRSQRTGRDPRPRLMPRAPTLRRVARLVRLAGRRLHHVRCGHGHVHGNSETEVCL